MKRKGTITSLCLGLALLATGCAKDAFIPGEEEKDGAPLIRLSLNSPDIAVGRGMGSVGEVDDNQWNSQPLHIYALKKRADFNTTDPEELLLDGIQALAPSSGNQGAITWADAVNRYYPLQGAYDFYGYHLDDATTSGPVKSQSNITIPFVIDGTQDIMVASAQLTYTHKVKLIQALITEGGLSGSVITDYINTEGEFVAGIDAAERQLIELEYGKAYSAYSARKDVQPILRFSHLLSRLQFHVQAGENQAIGQPTGEGVYITSVKLTSVSDGAIVIGREKNGLTIGSTNSVFELKQKPPGGGNLIALEPTAPESLIQMTQVGESMMVMPEVESYQLELTVRQTIDQNGNPIGSNQEYTYPLTVELPLKEGNKQSFEAGKSYNVLITISGLQTISIEAELIGWIAGDDIVINPDDSFYN